MTRTATRGDGPHESDTLIVLAALLFTMVAIVDGSHPDATPGVVHRPFEGDRAVAAFDAFVARVYPDPVVCPDGLTMDRDAHTIVLWSTKGTDPFDYARYRGVHDLRVKVDDIVSTGDVIGRIWSGCARHEFTLWSRDGQGRAKEVAPIFED